MPTPVEICLEELDLPDAERFIRCVALPGGQPGLALDRAATVRWMPEAPAAYGLWVSADERLMLLRAADTAPISVSRGGRTREVPVAMPVVLLDQDLLAIAGRRLRVHLHGIAAEVHPPERLRGNALARAARAAVTTLALGASLGAGSVEAAAQGPTTPIEVRAQPPAPPPAPRVDCTITKMTQEKKDSPVMVHARCPAPTPRGKLTVGAAGQILDSNGVQVPDGTVVLKKLDGGAVVCESKLKKPVKATLLRFWLSRY
jgi:hypothetical protein